MPLTTAHPILVAPLWHVSRKWLDLPALIVGSAVPDIKYFLHLRTMDNIGHTAFGILVQGIPASLCLLAIFGFILLQPMRALSPAGFGRILPNRYDFFPKERFAIIIVSIVIGAATHVFWDSFTHRGWFFVRLFPVLDMQVGPLPVYKYLQYVSGVLGSAAVLAWAIFAIRKAPVQSERIAHRFVPTCIILVTAIIVTYFALGKNNPLTPYITLIQTVIGSIAGVSLGLFVFAVVDRIRPFQRVRTRP
ncbi:MAG: DUF4184 family protein [Pseudomonadota bacterium]